FSHTFYIFFTGIIFYFIFYLCYLFLFFFFFFSSRRRHTRSKRDWSSDVCSSDLCSFTFLHCEKNRWRLCPLYISHSCGESTSSRDRKSVRVGKECRYRWERYH